MQEMLNQMNEIEVDRNHQVKIDRGPESFYIDRSAFQNLRGRRHKREAVTELEEGEVSSDDSLDSYSSLSSGGLSDGALAVLKGRQPPKKSKKFKKKQQVRTNPRGFNPLLVLVL